MNWNAYGPATVMQIQGNEGVAQITSVLATSGSVFDVSAQHKRWGHQGDIVWTLNDASVYTVECKYDQYFGKSGNVIVEVHRVYTNNGEHADGWLYYQWIDFIGYYGPKSRQVGLVPRVKLLEAYSRHLAQKDNPWTVWERSPQNPQMMTMSVIFPAAEVEGLAVYKL